MRGFRGRSALSTPIGNIDLLLFPAKPCPNTSGSFTLLSGWSVLLDLPSPCVFSLTSPYPPLWMHFLSIMPGLALHGHHFG